jgi:hypothetical protein
MTRRPATLALCLIGALLVAAPLAAADKRQKPRAFVEQSAIVAPKRIGEFVLEGSQQWPEQKFAGVQFRYQLPGHEELRIDVFVYPHGDMPEAKALETGMDGFRDTFEDAIQRGYFKEFRIVSDEPFRLETAAVADARPAAEQAPAATSPSSASTSAETDVGDDDRLDRAIAERLAASAKAANGRQGRRMLLSYRIPDPDMQGQQIEMRSMGYLFYRQLYLFKGRISAAGSQIDDAEFQILADRAMRTLIPAIQAFNAGACAQVAVAIDPDDDSKARAETMILDMISGMNARIERNCSERLDTPEFEAASRDAEVRRIDYEPGDWGDTP